MSSTKEIKPAEFTTKHVLDQSPSKLFAVLPGEVRNQIWTYALSDYEDSTRLYDDATCYKRPDYLAPRRIDTALLRTCKRVYQESWFLPWSCAEHAFYLAWNSRKPARNMEIAGMQRALKAFAASHIEPDIRHVRVYAQLCNLEPGGSLQQILNMEHFKPRSMTITIRHTDWWSWESDDNLHIGANWVGFCQFPNSLTELRVAFESLERKKEQIDEIAADAATLWRFRRQDDTVLAALENQPEVMRWSGSSTWENNRWLRDETSADRLDYYVRTITWRPMRQTATKIEPHQPSPLGKETFPSLDANGLPKAYSRWDQVSLDAMAAAGIARDASTAEVLAAMETWTSSHHDEDGDEYSDSDEQEYVSASDEEMAEEDEIIDSEEETT